MQDTPQITPIEPISPNIGGFKRPVAENAEVLVGRIFSGDEAAEQVLAKQFQPRIKRLGRSLGADAALCEDLAQEVLLNVIVKLRAGRLNDKTKLGAYIDQTTRFTYYGWRRNKNSQLEFKASYDDAQGTGDVEEMYQKFRSNLWIRSQIEKLRMARDRQLLLRFYFDHQDKYEVCEELDLSHDQFDKLMCRARNRLRKVAHD